MWRLCMTVALFSPGDLEVYRVMGRIIDSWRVYDVLATA